MNTRDDEILIIEKFQKLYSKNPFDSLIKSESPDFIASSLGMKIGIEITQVFQDSNIGYYSKLQQYSSESYSITNQLINEIQPHINFKFSIGIEFNESQSIRKSQRKHIVQKLKDRCINLMSNLKDNQEIILNRHDDLPKEAEIIYIERFDDMDCSFDSRPEGGLIRDLLLDHIQPILSRKEQKIIKYVPCDKYWLIIGEGKYFARSFSRVAIGTPINSSFDKVFLIRTSKNELIELK